MSIFLIAEIGINHNGDLNIAKKLIDYASDAGFDAVKFQKRNIEKVYTKAFWIVPEKAHGEALKEIKKRGLNSIKMTTMKLTNIAGRET